MKLKFEKTLLDYNGESFFWDSFPNRMALLESCRAYEIKDPYPEDHIYNLLDFQNEILTGTGNIKISEGARPVTELWIIDFLTASL